MKRRFAALGCSVALSFSLIAGCASLDGVDLAKAVQNAGQVESYEGSGSLSLQVTAGEAADGYPDVAKLNNVTLELTHVKQQDKTHSSVVGVLKTGSGEIPLEASQTDKEWVIKAEGASKPLVLQNNLLGGAKEGAAASPIGLDFTALDWQKLLQNHLGSLLKYAPKPDSLTVADAKVTINGEDLSLKKVHAELKGSELAGLIAKTLSNVLADEEQGTELIRSIVRDAGYDADNAYLFAIIKGAVASIAQDPSQLAALPPFSSYLTDSYSLKLDLYVDGESQIRRLGFELGIKNLPETTGGASAITVTGLFDKWNINKPVTADQLSTEGAIKASEGGGFAKYLMSLDKDSKAYQFLIRDLKANRKHIELPPVGSEVPKTEVRPYLLGNTTMVPVRLVTEQLDAQVEWNPDTYEVTVTDIWSGQKIVFKIGSKSILLNGAEETLEESAVLGGDTTYVPLRIIAETFGAKVGWNPDTYVVTIVRN